MRRKGMRFENRARRYLERRGLRTLQQNFSCRFGEIDLVMRDRDCVCFVEVKYRRNSGFGGAAAAISPAKRRRIVRTALVYLAANRKLTRESMRFDVLLIEGNDGDDDAVEWIRNAFYAE